MIAAAWALTLVGVLLGFAGYAGSKAARMKWRDAGDAVLTVPQKARAAIEAETTSSMLLGVGLMVLAFGLVAFMAASVLP